MKQNETVSHKRNQSLLRRLSISALLSAVIAITPSLFADPPPPHGIVAAHIGVEQLTTGNTPPDVIVTNILAVNDFRIRPSANRGDFDIQIGEDLADDVAGGVLITSVAEHTRDQGDSGQLIGTAPNQVPAYTAGPHTATSHLESQAAGSYFIPIAFTLPNSIATTVVEYNINVAAAWFPYDRYLGMYIGNATGANGGVNDTKIAGSQELVVGTHFIDDNVNPLGDATVNLTSLGINGNSDGVLLVLGAKNEDNYALSQVNTDGSWTLFSKDNGTDGTALERDPLAFVYIPKTNQYLTTGRFAGDASILITSTNKSVADFTVAHIDVGRWELKVAGGGPDQGVLIISPEGGQPLNRDNIVTYQPNDARDGWIIESRDLPDASLPPLEDVGTEPVASFVYIPGSAPGFLVTPSNNLFTSESGSTATFTVALETKPKADVIVNVSSSNTSEGTVDVTSLTFTPENWNTPQTVTITGVDDSNTDGPAAFNIILAASTSTDADYNGRDPIDVTVTNIDNEGGITVNPTGGLTTTEAAGTATFTVRLTQAPTADVTISLSSSDSSEGSVAPASLTFTSANWDQEQTVTITGADDFIDDGNITYSIITAAAVSTDPFFNNRNPADVTVENADDDTAGVTITPTSGLTAIESAGTAVYTIVLKTQPTADVTVTAVSEDTTEGTVSPATFTFNASNWNVEQAFTLTGVDDLLLDGNISYFLTHSFASADPLYSAITPILVAVTTLDDEPVITLPQVVKWGIGGPAVGIAGRATIVDPNTPNYSGSTLRVALTGASPDDRLEIRNVGAGEGQIGVSGNTINYGGAAIGTFTGGQGSDPLVITLNVTATPASTEALLRTITFRNVAAEPAEGSRTATVTLTDAGGAVVSQSVEIRIGLLRVTQFQEGADHGYGVYTGAADIELNQVNPDFPYPTGRTASGLLIDWPDDQLDPPVFNAGQVLLRFDNLVGDGPNQIPTNAIIVSAELFLDINDTGDGSPLHRMLVPWDSENETWNSIGGGVQLDDQIARSIYESQIGTVSSNGATTVGTVWVSVTPDVNAWVNGGETNFGWVLPAWPGNRDGTFFSPSETASVADRPRLRVSWLPKDSASIASFRQGVNDYAAAVDTRIRENAPDTDFSAVTSVFVDAQVAAGDPNMEQVLIRFDDIFGSGASQIPPGSKIHAAVLDLASVGGDAMGDGGQFFAILQPWGTNELGEITWNTFQNGVQTNGVEAATTPTAVAGSPTLDPDVQGGFLGFDLTADVQAWSSGARTNAGWVIIPWPGGGNGWGFATSDAADENTRPRLRVFYTPGSPPPAQIEIGNIAVTPTGVQIPFSGITGNTASIYRATSVDGAWTKIGDATVNNGSGSFTDTTPPATQAFYRVGQP